jgi:hypothetical protein
MGNNASQSAAVVRERLVRTCAKKLAAKLEQVLPNKPVEADFRHAVEPLFDGFCLEAGIPPLDTRANWSRS